MYINICIHTTNGIILGRVRGREACDQGPGRVPLNLVLVPVSFVELINIIKTSSMLWLQCTIYYHPWVSSTPTTAIIQSHLLSDFQSDLSPAPVPRSTMA